MDPESLDEMCIMTAHNVSKDLKQLDYKVVELFHCHLLGTILWSRYEDTIL